jgi:hypothetical protein
MKAFSGVLLLGISLWMGAFYYPWPTQSSFPLELGGRLKSMPEPIPEIDYYGEVKFWFEKSGQALVALGTLGTLLNQWKRRKK